MTCTSVGATAEGSVERLTQSMNHSAPSQFFCGNYVATFALNFTHSYDSSII